MGQTANELLGGGIDAAELADSLDRLYCYHLAGFCWTVAMGTRLSGQALFMLVDELEEVADEHLAAARSLAGRISEIGHAVTADPTEFVARSPLDQLTTPAGDSIQAILCYALDQVRVALTCYSKTLERTRGADDITHKLLIGLARQQASRETDLEGSLGI